MIKKTLFALSLIMGMTLLIYATKQQEKEYTVKATLQEWILITSPQDDVPKNARDNFIKKIASQLQPQLAQDTIPKKK